MIRSNSFNRSRTAPVRGWHLYPAFFGMILAAGAIEPVSPGTAIWTVPTILFAAMMIAWAAESAQFFMAQGFALAILAWLQTLPEFAVEAVLAWKQIVPLLLANLTGALRLLTGLGWPLIYFTAAFFHRRRYKRSLHTIHLADEHCIEVIGLLAPLVYMSYVWWKASLDVIDAMVLIGIYAAYLLVLAKMPPQEEEGIEDLERIPRSIVKSRPPVRKAIIIGLFVGGGSLIYFAAEPFLGSLLAISALIGVPSFVFVQWVAPFVSEFPEKVSAFYWARTVERAPMALMNMVSSNINQWTLLAAMLPIVFSVSRGGFSTIPFDDYQKWEILMTLAQSLVGMLFLINMQLVWWEASALFILWFVQFLLSPMPHGAGFWGMLAANNHKYITIIYLVWAGVAIIVMMASRRHPLAFKFFATMWRRHIRPSGPPAVR